MANPRDSLQGLSWVVIGLMRIKQDDHLSQEERDDISDLIHVYQILTDSLLTEALVYEQDEDYVRENGEI